VIRFSASLPAGMPGTELRKQDFRAALCLLPATAFQRLRINARNSACWLLLSGAGFSQRPFTRLERLRLRSATIPRSMLPVCYFDALLSRFQTR